MGQNYNEKIQAHGKEKREEREKCLQKLLTFLQDLAYMSQKII